MRGLRTVFLILATVVIAGCEFGTTCVDYAPNVEVTDVSTGGSSVVIDTRQRLSYCEGTDEHPFMVERVQLDLAGRTAAVESKATNDDRPLDQTPGTVSLLQGGSFVSNLQCIGCQLRLGFDGPGGVYALILATPDSPGTFDEPPLQGELRDPAGELAATFELGIGETQVDWVE